MTAHAESAVARLISIFGEPRTPDPKGFLDEYIKALGSVRADVLKIAVDRVVKRATFWPRPGEINAEADNILDDMDREADRRLNLEKQRRLASMPRHEPTPDEAARVRAMVDRALTVLRNARPPMMPGQTAHPLAAPSIRSKVVDPKDYEPDWIRGQRPGFEQMQRESTTGLHIERGKA